MSYNNTQGPNKFYQQPQPQPQGTQPQQQTYTPPTQTTVYTPQTQPQTTGYVQQQPAKESSFVQYSSLNYYDNRGTLDRNGAQQNNQAWDVRFNELEAVQLLTHLQEALLEGQGRGVVVRFTTGKRGNQKYDSGGFTIRGKKEKQADTSQFVPRNR